MCFTCPLQYFMPAGLPELQPQEPDTAYPLIITLSMLAVVAVNLVLFGAMCWHTFRLWRWVFALFGPLQPAALAVAALYLATAAWLYSQPVNALQLHSELRRPCKLAKSATTLQDRKAA
jgi:hypothetical protein